MNIYPRRSRRRALTLIECIVLMVVLSIVSVAAGVGLQSVSKSPAGVENKLWTSEQIASKLESLRDTAYGGLTSGSAASDPDYKGVTYTMTWTVTEIDPDYPTNTPPVTQAGSGFKQVVVSMNGQSMTTWVSQ
jgi:type II secretory pathway pseudopilin PulG